MDYSRNGIKGLVVTILIFSLFSYLVDDLADLFSKGGFISGRNAFAAAKEHSGFVALADKLSPAVVNISTNQMVKAPEALPEPFRSPFGEEDPFSDFWEKFFGDQFPHLAPFPQRSLGSGFIIDAEGYILTNNHVIANAEEITVKLANGSDFEAEVIGTDAKTDIALIKIEADESLAAVIFGDSDKLQVGEWVVAIGNPFGLDRTVTAGIVSAKGRVIGAGPYDSFIQTDASINPGNSGGPLINMEGEVVGVNTAIFSRSGGNIGIGFAIPINLVKDLLPELKSKGRVVRGWLGVTIQKVTPELAESLGMARPRGALVSSVSTDSPAERGGMKAGDVIIEYDGKKIEDSGDLRLMVARTPAGKNVQVKVLRNNEEMNLSVSVGALKEEEVVAAAEEAKKLGLTVQNVTPEIAESLGLDRAEGVVVSAVRSGSPADEAGFRRGDVILEIDRQPIKNLSSFQKAVRDNEKGKALLVLVDRGETTIFLALDATG